jgi:Flp pilus assembly protein TadD
MVQAFDFTPESYDPRFPQRIISKNEALALFYNNRALDYYRTSDVENALHLIKIATSLSPGNPDIWANVGAILKANSERERAKQALLYSLEIDPHHLVAVSQLERLYREDGDTLNADRYAQQAQETRDSNPYFLFTKSKQGFLDGDYNSAKKMIAKAINRHRYDPRFFALLGMIESKNENYKAAQRNFKKASKLEKNQQQKLSYANKAEILSRAHRSQKRETRPWVNTAPVSPSILGN